MQATLIESTENTHYHHWWVESPGEENEGRKLLKTCRCGEYGRVEKGLVVPGRNRMTFNFLDDGITERMKL